MYLPRTSLCLVFRSTAVLNVTTPGKAEIRSAEAKDLGDSVNGYLWFTGM